MSEKEAEDRLNKIELLESNFESEKQKLREQVLIRMKQLTLHNLTVNLAK